MPPSAFLGQLAYQMSHILTPDSNHDCPLH